MGVRLSADEAWRVLEAAHTGMVTTLRSDGYPITLPVWFVVWQRTICFGAPSKTRKVARIRRDPRASFLVESGEHWSTLTAVHLNGDIEIVQDPSEVETISSAIDRKYAGFTTAAEAMPADTRAHYSGRTFLRLRPQARILSWDNSKIALGD